MNTYEIRKIDLSGIKNADDYRVAEQNAETDLCKGLKAAQDLCGGKLYRCRAGYSRFDGKYEYVVTRVVA